MNDNTNISAVMRRSVVAIAKEDNKLKAVEIRKHGKSLEVVWARSTDDADTDWRQFATRCGLTPEPTGYEETDGDKMVVVGFSSAGTVFHRTSVPAVGNDEIASIVALQAETRLPLPAEQTELAWRVDPAQDGQVSVTMVVARKELLQQFAQDVRCLGPSKILLNCEGTIAAWKAIFVPHEKNAVIMSMGARSTLVCLADDARLSNAVILDMGMDDFTAVGEDEQTETTERFAQDMRSVLDLFGYAGQPEFPVFLLADDGSAYISIVSALRSAGFNARLALPNVGAFTPETGSGIDWTYEYRTPMGLALMALEGDADQLNIFERVYSPTGKEEKKHWLYSPKVACAIASVMLLLLAIVSYEIDLKSPKSITKRVKASISDSEMDMDQLVERQRLIKAVARERPDMLALLKLINGSGEKGVVLNSVIFKKDQKVTITGQLQGPDQLYKFQESLGENKDIDDVTIQNWSKASGKTSGGSSARPPSGSPSRPPSRPPSGPTSRAGAPTPGRSRPPMPGRSSAGSSKGKGVQITFTMTFHYKNFTKKTTRTRG
ncbi:MAG: hypothetical protein ACYSUD_07935 [Planctomycetota bacterium]|jgi:hypothetical protein